VAIARRPIGAKAAWCRRTDGGHQCNDKQAPHCRVGACCFPGDLRGRFMRPEHREVSVLGFVGHLVVRNQAQARSWTRVRDSHPASGSTPFVVGASNV
jgi:hypothetical protein